MREPIQWGDLRRLHPFAEGFGHGRGQPVGRHRIEGFLARHAAVVRGRMLEVGSSAYTRCDGGSRVTQADVLHLAAGHGHADFVADLAVGDGLPGAAFDSFICTPTPQYVFDLRAAVATIHRILTPGGVLLLTVPGILQISPFDRDRWGEHWRNHARGHWRDHLRFTPRSVARLLAPVFGAAAVEVQSHGNVLAATAFLQGLACADLGLHEPDARDDRYPVVATARAVR